MAKKIEHETPPGFRRRAEKGRVTYNPGIAVRAVHKRLHAQVKAHPLTFADPLPEVRQHLERGHRYFLKTDLSSAFDHVTAERLRAALKHRGINPGWLSPLQYFFHEMGRGGLIQGAPASPYLFETYCRYGGLDRDLGEYCDKLGFCYTRYVDDILISSHRPIGKRVGPSVRRIVGAYGFALSDKKTKRVDVYAEPLEVLGYLIRGPRIDPAPRTLQTLFDPQISDVVRAGIFRWRRRVRTVGRRRRAVHK
jgi:hypothetical protein